MSYRYTYHGKAYRFMDVEGFEKTIKNQKLRYSRVDCLNDPLDCGIHIIPMPRKLRSLLPKHKRMTEKEKFITRVLNPLYVVCFSKNYFERSKSYLMWSYYANKHTGVCFEIDFNKYNLFGGPEEVIYKSVNEIVKIRDDWNPYEPHIKKGELGIFIATTKSLIGEHEEEVRLIADITMDKFTSNLINFSFEEDDKYLHIQIENLSVISKVIFGINTQESDMVKIKDLLASKSCFPKFEQMEIDESTLEFKPRIIS